MLKTVKIGLLHGIYRVEKDKIHTFCNSFFRFFFFLPYIMHSSSLTRCQFTTCVCVCVCCVYRKREHYKRMDVMMSENVEEKKYITVK